MASSVETLNSAAAAWRRSHVWMGKSSLAVIDEGLVSGSNFVLVIVLARWLGTRQYGAYALAFSVFLLLAGLYQAVLLEPMSVFGPLRRGADRRDYLGAVLWIHAGICTVCALALGAAGFVLAAAQPDLAAVLRALAVALPSILLLWLARAACYLRYSPATAAAAALMYSCLLLGGLVVVNRSGLLSSPAVFLSMGGASLAVALCLLAGARPRLTGMRREAARVWREHWTYSRWALCTAAVMWVPGNIFYVATGALAGMGATGSLRALLNIALPVTHSGTALVRLFQPYLSERQQQRGTPAIVPAVGLLSGLFAAGALAYALVFAVFHVRVFGWLYAGRFVENSWMAAWVAVGVVFQMAAYGIALGLRAVRSPASIFAAYSTSAAISVLIGIPGVWLLGLPGAVGSTVVSNIALAIVQAILLRRKVRHGGC